jgi:hypothetical protein
VLAASHKGIEELEQEVQIEKTSSAKLERWLNKCKSEPEATQLMDISQLLLEKDMPLHRPKNFSS